MAQRGCTYTASLRVVSMRRPVPIEYIIVSILRTKKELWFSDLVQAVRAYYPDATESEILKALMRLELSRIIVVESSAKKDNPYYIRLIQQ